MLDHELEMVVAEVFVFFVVGAGEAGVDGGAVEGGVDGVVDVAAGLGEGIEVFDYEDVCGDEEDEFGGEGGAMMKDVMGQDGRHCWSGEEGGGEGRCYEELCW